MHHNPTAGPADGEWMYGHSWVSLCFLATLPSTPNLRKFKSLIEDVISLCT